MYPEGRLRSEKNRTWKLPERTKRAHTKRRSWAAAAPACPADPVFHDRLLWLFVGSEISRGFSPDIPTHEKSWALASIAHLRSSFTLPFSGVGFVKHYSSQVVWFSACECPSET